MKRNYGIDLLKLLSSFMVVTLHLIVNSGLLSENNILTIPGELTWLIWTFCFCAVLCFAITSGYVGFNNKHNYSGIIYLWLIVEFYTVILGLVEMLFINKNFQLGSFINLFFPTFSRKYWYFSEYVLLFILMPALDSIVEHLPKEKCKNIIIISLLLITICQNVIYPGDFLELGHGYSALWLGILYCIGAYIKKYNPLNNISNKKLLILSLSMPFIAWLWQFICRLLFSNYEYMNVIQYFFYSRHTVFISYLSITMVLQSFFMVLLFTRLSINESQKKVIKLFSPLSFSIYIIHTTTLFAEHVDVPLGIAIANLDFQLSPLLFIACAIVVWLLCALIDLFRNLLFTKIRIKDYIAFIDEKKLRY